MNRKQIAAFVAVLFPCMLSAQGHKTYVSSAYFGPNAFQVPQMNDAARTSGNLQAILTGDFILGHTGQKDYTGDIYLELHIPLFTDRVNLSAWGALQEWYDQSDDVLAYRGLPADPSLAKGHKTGAFFISSDIQVLRERQYWPAILLRAGMRTASENDAYPVRRGYDAAGYFFDLSLGKTFGPVGVSASAGFLCWQTGVGVQNDAVQFGAKVNYTHEYVRAAAQYGGYWGWRHDGDFPQVLFLQMDFGPQNWYVKPYVLYQHGFHDWPFDLFRAGVKLGLSILK